MKNPIYLLSLILLLFTSACNNSEENEVPCSCNEVLDKEAVIIQYSPNVVFDFRLYVRNCDGEREWVSLGMNQTQWEDIYLGDCY